MSSRAAPSEASSPSQRVLVVDNETTHDVFEVVGTDGAILRVRSPYLFEIGEELAVRIEEAGAVSEATVRVRAHVGTDDKITELEISDRSAPRPMVTG